jgi:hypothetical protein
LATAVVGTQGRSQPTPRWGSCIVCWGST